MRILGDLGRVVGRDVDHRRLQLLGQLGELIAELHGAGNHQRRSVRSSGLPARGVDTGIDERPDDDPDRERNEQETQRQQLLLSHHLKPPHGLGIAFLYLTGPGLNRKLDRRILVPTISESAEKVRVCSSDAVADVRLRSSYITSPPGPSPRVAVFRSPGPLLPPSKLYTRRTRRSSVDDRTNKCPCYARRSNRS